MVFVYSKLSEETLKIRQRLKIVRVGRSLRVKWVILTFNISASSETIEMSISSNQASEMRMTSMRWRIPSKTALDSANTTCGCSTHSSKSVFGFFFAKIEQLKLIVLDPTKRKSKRKVEFFSTCRVKFCYFLVRSEITNRKNQITNKIQCPISEISNKIKALVVALVLLIVICCLRFIPDQNIRGQAWELLFDIWNFPVYPV